MASLLYRFLYWWSGHLPLRLISKAGGPYLERYYLFTLFGHRFYLHRFVASDPDGWHDHPFANTFSIVLWGEYGEEYFSPDKTAYAHRDWVANCVLVKRRIVRWFNWIGARHTHRVVIGNDWSPVDGEVVRAPRSKECWTLFVHEARYTKAWGFWKETADQFRSALKFAYMTWKPWDGKRGLASSGQWWTTNPIGRLTAGRLPSLYAKTVE